MTVHDHVQQVLSAARDGEADPDQRFLAERHLRECARCQVAVAAFDRIDERAREVLLRHSPAPSFEAALAMRLATEPGRDRPGPRAGRRRRLWRSGLAAALTVLALVVVVVRVGGPSSDRGPLPSAANPSELLQPSTLAAVLVRAEQVAEEIRTLQGRFTRTWSGMPTRSGSGGTVTGSYRFTFASPDRVRIEGGPGAEVRLQIHDGPAASRVVQLREDPQPLVTTGVTLARPQDLDALAPLSEGVTLWFRHRLEDPERPASLATREGRRVYVLRLRYGWSVAGPPQISHLEVWLDPASYLPTRIQYQDRTRAGRVVVRGDVRYSYERVNRPVPPRAFAIPPGAQVASGGRFRSMPLVRAQALASYPVPEVKALPQPGWRLLRSGFAPVGQPTGPEAGNPAGRDLVVAVYGGGLERLVMTSVLVDEQAFGGRAYTDPFAGEGVKGATRTHRLGGGAYTGTVAFLGVPSDDAPYLWFRSGQVVVTLSGAATARQLITAAESLTH